MHKLMIVTFLLLAFSLNAHGALKTVGKGETLNFDPSVIPANLKNNYAVMQAKCVKCHTMERTVVAVRSGVAPISGGVFDRNAIKRYGVKMLRKADSNMTKDDVKVVTDVLNSLLDDAGK